MRYSVQARVKSHEENKNMTKKNTRMHTFSGDFFQSLPGNVIDYLCLSLQLHAEPRLGAAAAPNQDTLAALYCQH